MAQAKLNIEAYINHSKYTVASNPVTLVQPSLFPLADCRVMHEIQCKSKQVYTQNMKYTFGPAKFDTGHISTYLV